MKILYLPLKKEWYLMIESGEKTEEYREVKAYWVKRLFAPGLQDSSKGFNFKTFDAITFSYGYTKRTMTFECKGIEIGKGKPEWGAPEEAEVFIIKLGKRIG